MVNYVNSVGRDLAIFQEEMLEWIKQTSEEHLAFYEEKNGEHYDATREGMRTFGFDEWLLYHDQRIKTYEVTSLIDVFDQRLVNYGYLFEIGQSLKLDLGRFESKDEMVMYVIRELPYLNHYDRRLSIPLNERKLFMGFPCIELSETITTGYTHFYNATLNLIVILREEGKRYWMPPENIAILSKNESVKASIKSSIDFISGSKEYTPHPLFASEETGDIHALLIRLGTMFRQFHEYAYVLLGSWEKDHDQPESIKEYIDGADFFALDALLRYCSYYDINSTLLAMAIAGFLSYIEIVELITQHSQRAILTAADRYAKIADFLSDRFNMTVFFDCWNKIGELANPCLQEHYGIQLISLEKDNLQ